MNYNDLINIDDLEKRENFNQERGDIAFYCKDCEELVETSRVKQDGYIFKCNKCKGINVAVGTLSGLKENYRIK